MAKGKLISKADGAGYVVEFELTTFANLKKEPATGTVAAGKPLFRLTVDSGEPIPDGDYELHPEGGKVAYNVTNSGDSWSVL